MTSAPPTGTVPGSTVEAEFKALSRVRMYAILMLAGTVLGYLISALTWSSTLTLAFSSALTAQTSSGQIAIQQYIQRLLLYLAGAVGLGGAFQLASALYLWSGLRHFVSAGRKEFSVCSTFMIVYLAGIVVAIPSALVMFWVVFGAIANGIGTTTIPSVALLADSILILLVVGTAGMLALIGVVGGVILGIWRVGTRYDNSLFKVASIFVIIPVLNIVGAILMLVGIGDAKTKLSI